MAFPHLRVGKYVIGKKHAQALPFWIPSLLAYGAIAVVGVIWIIDYKDVMKHIPFVRRRFRYPYEEDKRVYIEPVYDL